MLLSLENVSVAFGGPPVLDGASLRIDERERIALVGRNGAGKSTLLKLISGELEAASGTIARPAGTTIAVLDQQVPTDLAETVFDEVARGLGDASEVIAAFHHFSDVMAHATDDKTRNAAHAELVSLEGRIEAIDGWRLTAKVDEVLSRMQLPAEAECAGLSAGLKRRVLLARSLVREPDLLLLDEPTNHLDLPSIAWLENFLLDYQRSVLFITHDRRFLSRLATRILEVDRGQLTSWNCNHATYVERKAAWLDAEAKQNALFDKKLAQEEVWIRTGVKARRTRNEGRVRALEQLRRERAARRERSGTARLQAVEGDRSGQLVAEAKGVSFAYSPDRTIVRDFTTLIMRGDKVGIIGPNGAGKTTLLRLILGELAPTAGTVRQGTNLQVAYFDQLHAQLDIEKSPLENVTDGADRVVVGGQSRHVIGYLEDFLFTSEQVRRPVKYLSGGERNRLLLARLFTKPSNVLVMDEPTNDLDVETLELLETLLAEYAGTVLLVSHDREFLANVATSTLVIQTDGTVKEVTGDFDDWNSLVSNAAGETAKPSAASKTTTATESPRSQKKLNNKERQELNRLPKRIADLESEQAALHVELGDPALYQGPAREVAKRKERLTKIENELTMAYARWEELDA